MASLPSANPSLNVVTRASRILCVGLGLLSCNRAPGSAQPASSKSSATPAVASREGRVSHPARRVKLLAFSDFHGQLEAGLTYEHRPVGGAAVLAAYLHHAMLGVESESLILVAGDHVGASPPISGLLQDEPSLLFANLLANEYCIGPKSDDARCNIVATLGNHEFDEGVPELQRLINGGDYPKGPAFEPGYPGLKYPVVCSNVVVESTGQLLRPAFVVREVGDVKLGVIGAVTWQTPHMVLPVAIEGLRFEDEANSINTAALALKQQGVRAIVVVIHEGYESKAYVGETRADAEVGEPIAGIVHRLDEEIDVVITGHAHGFTNAFVQNRGNRSVLVTQALSRGMAFADIDLSFDDHGEVTNKVAQIVPTYADQAPGTQPDAEISKLVAAAREKVEPRVDVVIGKTTEPLLARAHYSGETALGDLIADAQRAAMGSNVAMANPGGIRADLPQGDITWGQAYAVQPFGNYLVRVTLTGEELKRYLEQQFSADGSAKINQVSGLSYVYDPKLPVGNRVSRIIVGKKPLDFMHRYTVTVNSFMANLGGPDAILVAAKPRAEGPGDLDALVNYFKSYPGPIAPPRLGRIRRIH